MIDSFELQIKKKQNSNVNYRAYDGLHLRSYNGLTIVAKTFSHSFHHTFHHAFLIKKLNTSMKNIIKYTKITQNNLP